MNTPKRLHSGSDDLSDYSNSRRRSRLSSAEELSAPVDEQIEQVARRHRVPGETVKRIFSDLLGQPTVIDYLRTRINQTEPPTQTDESTCQNLFTNSMDDPLWMEFLQSLNTSEANQTNIQPNTTQSTVTFDSLFSEEDEDDEEFIGPDDEHPIENPDEKKLRVSKRELALLLKDNHATPEDQTPCQEEELLPSDQYESLWTEFLAALQRGNESSTDHPQNEQTKSLIPAATEDDDNDDDPEFRLPETDYDLEDDLGEELHVSRRELALLLEDNASILTPDEFLNPESVSSTITSSTTTKPLEFHLTSNQRQILQYQFSAYVQLLTQYVLLQRENNSFSVDHQSAMQLFNDLIYFRDKQSNSILNIPLVTEAQQLIESSPPSTRRKALGNHLPFHLMDTFCKNPAFVHDSLLPTCPLTSSTQSSRNFVSGEDCLMALGLEQNDAKMLIFGHNDKSINDRLNSLRYARVRRGKQNPVKAFFTYGSVPDVSLQPWYQLPTGFNIQHIYSNGLIEKANVVFPPWFRLSYKRSRQLTKQKCDTLPSSISTSLVEPSDTPSSSTVYVVVEDSASHARPSTSPNKVLQQIHMLHLLNSYPKLQPKQK